MRARSFPKSHKSSGDTGISQYSAKPFGEWWVASSCNSPFAGFTHSLIGVYITQSALSVCVCVSHRVRNSPGTKLAHSPLKSGLFVSPRTHELHVCGLCVFKVPCFSLFKNCLAESEPRRFLAPVALLYNLGARNFLMCPARSVDRSRTVSRWWPSNQRSE